MIKITLNQEDLEKEIRQAFVHGQGNRALMEVGLERDETEDYVNSRMRSLLNLMNTKPGFVEKRLQQQKEQDVYEISKVAIKIVAYFNQDVTVWDSKMYEQKHVVIELLNQLNQNKDE